LIISTPCNREEEFPYVVVLMIDETNPAVQNSSNTAGVAVHDILKYLISH
jgi:hypothetical protein